MQILNCLQTFGLGTSILLVLLPSCIAGLSLATSGAKSEKKAKEAPSFAPLSSLCQSTGTAAASLLGNKELPVAATLSKVARAEIPRDGGMMPRPVRLMRAAAVGSAAMPAIKLDTLYNMSDQEYVGIIQT